MKKYLLLILLLFSLTLTSCGKNKLEKAMEALDEKSYTVETSMKLDMTVTYMGITQNQSVVMEMKMEGDPSQTYTTTKANGQTQYTYVKIENEQVKTYHKTNDTWTLLETVDLEEYTNSMMEMVDIDDVEDYFSKENGVWVGNQEKLSEMMEEIMEELAGDLAGSGLTINSAEITKYNITLDGNNVSLIDIEMNMDMSASGVSMKMKISMPMEFSEIGKTKVTVPEGLPE